MKTRVFSDNWNFWTVKYLRQARHNFSLLVCIGVLLLVQFLIFRSYLGEMPFPRSWPPWWLFMLLVGCGLGTGICVAICFGAPSEKNRGGGFEHFTGFSPLDADALFRGYLFSFLLTFGILFGSCAFAWGTAIFFFPGHALELLFWSLNCCFLSFILLQLDGRRSGRPDQLALILLVLFLLFRKLFLVSLHPLPDLSLTISLLLAAAYLALLLRESLLPRGAVREVVPRLGSIVFPAAGILLDIPELSIILVACALAATGGAVDGIPHRQLKRLAGSSARRVAVWLFYGSSAGGWIWCWACAGVTWWILFSHEGGNEAWLFLASWGLASAETGFLIASLMRRRAQRSDTEKGYHGAILVGCLVVLIAFLMIGVTFGIDGEEVFRTGATLGWGVAAVLLIPNLPRMIEDYRTMVLGRYAE